MIKCDFLEPVNLGLFPDKPDWAFSKMECVGDLDYSSSTFPAYLERIENAGNSFFLEKNISYGDFLVIAFLILILIGLSVAGIRDFTKNRKLERL